MFFGSIPQIVINRGSGMVRLFKLDCPASFLLPDCSPIQRITVRRNIFDPQSNRVAATEFAVDREVEKCQIADSSRQSKLRSYRPDMLRQQWRLLA